MYEEKDIEKELNDTIIKKSQLKAFFNSKNNRLEAPHKNLLLIQINTIALYESILMQRLILTKNNN